MEEGSPKQWEGKEKNSWGALLERVSRRIGCGGGDKGGQLHARHEKKTKNAVKFICNQHTHKNSYRTSI